MKTIKAWAVVMQNGKVRDFEGLCVFSTRGEVAKKYLSTGKLVRVEIREVAPKKGKGKLKKGVVE